MRKAVAILAQGFAQSLQINPWSSNLVVAAAVRDDSFQDPA